MFEIPNLTQVTVEACIKYGDWFGLAEGLSNISLTFTWEERREALQAASRIFELLGRTAMASECKDRIFGPGRYDW